MKYIIIGIALLLSGCNKPDPLTDAQVKAITDSCKSFGYTTRIVNNENGRNVAECSFKAKLVE